MKRTTKIGYSMTNRRVERALDENIALGYVELFGVNEDGEPLYQLTPEGEAHVRDLINGEEAAS